MDGLLTPGGFDVGSSGVAWLRALTDALSSGLLVWAIVVAAVLCVLPALIVVRRRRFRCAQAQRDVEVDFEEHGLPGHRRPISVLSCSAFDPRTHVQCDCACLNREAAAPAESVRAPVAARRDESTDS